MSNLSRTAVLYRVVMPGQICPWGLRARYLLKGRGYAIDDRGLTTRDAVEAFKAERGVRSLPQIFIDGVRIGGYDDLRRYLGLKVREPETLTYTPMRWSY